MACCAHCGNPLDNENFGEALFSLRLTKTEYELLKRLINAKGAPLHYERLMAMLYSHKDGCTFNTLRVTVSMLNRRILDVGYRILNVKEYGYRLVRTSRSQAMTTTGEWSPVDIQCN
jgi:DNA-binding response OmpR family regulator